MKARAAIARIDVPRAGAPPSRGTGALVAPRLVLTALHVVADREQDPPAFFAGPIKLTFPGAAPVAARPVDGLWDTAADWALLECDEAPGVPTIPLGELRADEEHARWETFGFPDIKPDGMAISGTVEDPHGTYRQSPAIQLYCQRLQDEKVFGFSGAPCVVDGALVGVIRASLLDQDRNNAAGTIHACPLHLVIDRAGARLPLPDPCRGLPGLPRGDLPDKPFRWLGGYTEAHAEIFFGRSAAIRDLYDKITDPDGAPIVLFSGQSGVGKSSLLDAGVRPRLGFTHAVRLARRDAARGLRASFEDAIERDWRALEAREGRPVVVILDQVEEAFTRPRGDPLVEIAELLDALAAVFGPGGARPRGKLVLSLRKEWLGDLETQVEGRRLPFRGAFLDRLDRAGVIEVVHGIESTERLRRRYEAVFEPGRLLGATIAGDLLEDPGSPVATVLQILMTRLWERAKKASAGAPALTVDLYREVKREGIHLDDFVRRQLEELPAQDAVASGLVDDLLEAHTTTRSTAQTHAREALQALYPQVTQPLLDALQNAYLLTSPEGTYTRLAHDTLAPIVQERWRQSGRPGQRARRVLEARAPEWERAAKGRPLDALDLRTVENGLTGMRAPTEAETRLIEASRRARERARRRRRFEWLGVALALASALGGYLVLDEERAKGARLERRASVDEAQQSFDRANRAGDPVEALIEACHAVKAAPDDDPRLGLYVARAQHLFTALPPLTIQIGGEILKHAELSEDWGRLLTQETTGKIAVWSLDLEDPVRGAAVSGPTTLTAGGSASLSPDGKWILTVPDATEPGRIWDAATGREVRSVPGLDQSSAFTPDSRAVATFREQAEKELRRSAVLGDSWALSGEEAPLSSVLDIPVRAAPPPGGLRALVVRWDKKVKKSRLEVLDVTSRAPAFPDAAPIDADGELDQVALSSTGAALAALSEHDKQASVEVWRAAEGVRAFRAAVPRDPDHVGGRTRILYVADDGRAVLVAHEKYVRSRSGLRTMTVDDMIVLGDGTATRVEGSFSYTSSDPSPLVRLNADRTITWDDGGSIRRTGGPAKVGAGYRPAGSLGALGRWLSRDGERVATLSSSGELGIHSLRDPVSPRRLQGSPGETIHAAQFTPGGERLFTISSGGRVSLWDVGSKVETSLGTAPRQALWDHIAVSPSGDCAAGAVSGREILMWEAGRQEPHHLTPGGRVRGLAVVGRGKALVVAAVHERRLDLLEWTAGSASRTVREDLPARSGDLYAVGLAADGRHLVYRAGAALSVREVNDAGAAGPFPFDDGVAPDLVQHFLLGSPELTVEPRDGGAWRVHAGGSPTVDLISVLGHSALRTSSSPGPLRLPAGSAHFLAFSAAGPCVARSLDASISVDALETGTPLTVLPNPAVVAAVFTPTGDSLLTLTRDGVLQERFIRHAYPRKPAWVAELGVLAVGRRIGDGGAHEAVPGALSGSARARLVEEIRAAAAAGDRGAEHVLRHLEAAR